MFRKVKVALRKAEAKVFQTHLDMFIWKMRHVKAFFTNFRILFQKQMGSAKVKFQKTFIHSKEQKMNF